MKNRSLRLCTAALMLMSCMSSCVANEQGHAVATAKVRTGDSPPAGVAGDVLSPEEQARLVDAAQKLTLNQSLESIERDLLQMQSAHPRHTEVLYQLARTQLKLGEHLTPSARGEASRGWDEHRIARSEALLDQVLELDESHAGAWTLYGYLKYLRRDFPGGLQMLQRAQALGSDASDMYRVLGQLRWAMAIAAPVYDNGGEIPRPDLQPAIEAYGKGIRGPVDTRVEAVIALDLGTLHQKLGDLDRAEQYFTWAIGGTEGGEKSTALHERARFQLYSRHDVDAALRDAESARDLADFGLLRNFHATALLVKAGTLCNPRCTAKATPYLDALRATGVDLSGHVRVLGSHPATFPALFAAKKAGLVQQTSDPVMSLALTWAIRTNAASPADIGRLLDMGVNPDVSDRDTGTALHVAIFSRNVPMAMLLLDRGADPTVPYRDGSLPLDIVEAKESEAPEMAPLLARLRADPRSARAVIALKKDGYYRPPSDMSIAFGEAPPPGSRLSYIGECQDSVQACLVFYVWVDALGTDNRWQIYVKVPRDRVEAFVASLEPLAGE